MLALLQAHCDALKEQHYLVRVRAKLGVKVCRALADGSAMVEAALRTR